MAGDPTATLRRRFPGLILWYGHRTRSWWALIPPPAGWRLVEAADPEQLTAAIIHAQSWPWPHPRQGAHWTLGVPEPPHRTFRSATSPTLAGDRS